MTSPDAVLRASDYWNGALMAALIVQNTWPILEVQTTQMFGSEIYLRTD